MRAPSTFRSLRHSTLPLLAGLACTSALACGGSHPDDAGGTGNADGTTASGAAAGNPGSNGATGGDGSGAGAAGSGGSGAGNPTAEPLPAPPNELPAGNGTPAEGGTVVYNGKKATTPGSQTSCAEGSFDNQYIVSISSLGGDFGLKFANIDIFLPLDKLTESRVFPIGPFPENNSFQGVDHAAVFVSGTDIDLQHGLSGSVWVKIHPNRVAEVRLSDVPLGAYETYEPTDNVASGALLCWSALP
jgi:hypothetical protein